MPEEETVDGSTGGSMPPGWKPRAAEEDNARFQWLGGRWFWIAAGAIVGLLALTLLVRRVAIASPTALVPIVSLSGPSSAAAGEKVRYAVLVRDRLGKAIGGAAVRIGFFKYGLHELAHGKTAEGGELEIDVPIPSDFHEPRALVAIAEADGAEDSDAITLAPRAPRPGSVYVSADKPIYQPGQTVHLRALAMADDKPVAVRPVVFEIRASDGIKVFRSETATSPFGVASEEFPLADQVKLGTYTIATMVDGGKISGTRQIEVKRYELPKLKLALEEPSPLVAGADLRGRVRASWIFGEPVTKGLVLVTLVQGGSVLRQVSGQLDREGAFRFTLPANKDLKATEQRPGAVTLRAKLDVEGGLHAEASTDLTTAGAGIGLEVFPPGGAIALGVEQEVVVLATHPVREGIAIHQDNGGPVARTNADGIALVTVRPTEPTSTVSLVAAAPDGATGSVSWHARTDRLVLEPDKLAYASGETASLGVAGLDDGDRVVVRLAKGDEPIAHASCVAAGGRCAIKLPLPQDLSGLAWIHALSLPSHGAPVRVGKRLVIVGGGGRDLGLAVTPDKPVYAPGDKGIVDVAVTAGGAPVKAELGVAVADEAVFALADVRPDLEKRFFTTDRDLAGARRPGGRSSADETTSEVAFPPAFDRYAVYEKATDARVRALVLAALATMPEAGGFSVTSSARVEERARSVVRQRIDTIGAWLVLLLTAVSVAAFGMFALYAGMRLRFAAPRAETEAVRIETRGLVVDWLVAVIGPPILVGFSLAASGLSDRSVREETQTVGCWAAVALLGSFLLLRGVLRVRRALAGDGKTTLRGVLLGLPIAAFAGHLAIVLFLAAEGRQLRALLDVREDAYLVPLVLALAAQVAFGFLSVTRQTLLRPVTRRGLVWLVASRAVFLGLPITLVCAVLLLRIHFVRTWSSWRAYDDGDTIEPIFRTASPDVSDNKEGGTGTRAKGEAGSMGAPSFAALAAPGAKNDGAPEMHVRDYFPETLLWAPSVLTDDAGHAKITVPFADSITAWRFGLRAVSAKGQLGSTTLPLVVKQDFFVDAALPPVLTQGDEIAVPVTVYGYGTKDQDVTVAIEGSGFSALGLTTNALHLAPGETRGLRYTIRADRAGERVVRIKAWSAAHADAEDRKVTVVPNGLKVVRTTNGRLTGDRTVAVDLPVTAIDGGNDLFVKVYGGPLSQVSEGLDGVFQMPHGCFEQTSSTTYPSILALDFLARSKSVSPEVEKKARRYIVDGYQRLVSFEVPGGGFSLFGHAPASTTLTAYGLLELADLGRVAPGLADEGVVARSRDWLYQRRSGSGGWARPSYGDRVGPDDPVVTAYVAWALAAADPKAADPRLAALLDRLRGDPDDDPYGLALRANALLAAGRANDARPLLERLAAHATQRDDGVSWTSSASGVLYSYGTSFEIEVTGLAAHALALAGMSPDLRAGALDWLVARRGSYGTWSTTQATIAAMRALLDEAKPVPKEPQDVRIVADGVDLETFRIEPAARDVHRLVGLRKFAAVGKHAVEIHATGAADVSFQVVSVHYQPWTAPQRQGLELAVAYAPDAIYSGQTTTCKVRIAWRGKEPAAMPLVEIAIPPSFEAETQDLEALLKKAPEVQRYAVERGKVTLYLVALAPDKPLAFDLRLRALRPAQVLAPASVAYLYYQPEVRIETAPTLLRAL